MTEPTSDPQPDSDNDPGQNPQPDPEKPSGGAEKQPDDEDGS